ncbi:matrilin-2 isoform X2 [Pogoniulus pusillus]|uniref:matrilin-2 isoform X2 n=1 Tax=Pogoniulus pusillus TaxID=488313 RepID=UPI0030B9401C
MKKMIACFFLLLGQALLSTLCVMAKDLPAGRSPQRRALSSQSLLSNPCSSKRLDLVFIIDSSRSVRPHDFEQVKEFLVSMLRFLDVRPDATRVALLQYGSTVKQEFALKTFSRKQDLERAVRRMVRLATGTMTGLALQYALSIAFAEAEGARPRAQHVPRVIMIVTDGRPQDPVAEVAARARNAGVLIFAIGVGSVDLNTLRAIGSEPHEEHVFLVANFSQIESLTSAFQARLCVPHMCSVVEHGCDHFCINTPGSYSCSCKQGYILNADHKTCSTEELCAAEQHSCQQICVNTPGSYVCQCYQGYELHADGKSCVVVDYCALDNQGCQHECVNTEDSYYCRCHPGFLLNPDKRTCRRPDYCALEDHGCEQECVNAEDSYFCRCQEGFRLNPDKKTCKRVDHCAESNHGCEQLCLNTESSYVCQCLEGFVINQDLKTCTRVDYCALSDHGCEHLCVNGDRSYSCQCFEGYRLRSDGRTCKRKNLCRAVSHGCEHICVSADNSYTCKCHEGFTLREDGKTCRNQDICSTVAHGCEHLCVSADESYTCQCPEGFALREDGRTCRNKDVCSSVDHGCEHLCVSTDSSYLCQCHEGFVLREDQRTCRSKDICKAVSHGCQHACVGAGESYVCTCQEGFLLGADGKTCRGKDVCSWVQHGCEQVCVNTEGSYVCQCHENFTLNEDGKTCRSKDVCSSADHGCEQVCVNTEGSYVCKCHEDFILREDGKSCRSKDLCKSIAHGCEHLCINEDDWYSCQCREGFVLRQDGKTCRDKDVCRAVAHGCEHTCVNSDDSYICKCQEGYVLREDQKTCTRCSEGPLDLVFVIDGSKSLGEDNFEAMKQFVSGVLDSLEISPSAARVGLLQFSSDVRAELTLRQSGSARDVQKALWQMKYMGRGSMTGLALRRVLERSFTEAEGARPPSAGVPRVAIVCTDGRAQDDVSEWAARAKRSGIIIYAIGIGKAIEEELLQIASEPSYKHLFYAEDFTALEDISEELRAQICEALNKPPHHQQDPSSGRLPKTAPQPSGPDSTTIAITDVIACPNLAVHHKYLFEDGHVHSTTAKASKDKEQCKCENLVTFQNYATSEVRKLTQRLEEMTKRMEDLENRLKY